MINTADRTPFRSTPSTVSLAEQAQILGWRVALTVTRFAARVWRDLAPILYPMRFLLWLPPMAAGFGFFVGLWMALTMR